MDSLDECSPEFVIGSTLFDELDAFSVHRGIDIFSCERIVLCECMFDIHRDIIYEIMLEEMLEHVRIAAVGVELDQKTEIFYLLAKDREIRMDSRFSSADDDSVEKAYSSFEESEKYVLIDEIVSDSFDFLREDELGIMAKTTPEIAPRCENDSRHFPGIIQECRFFDGSKLHIIRRK